MSICVVVLQQHLRNTDKVAFAIPMVYQCGLRVFLDLAPRSRYSIGMSEGPKLPPTRRGALVSLSLKVKPELKNRLKRVVKRAGQESVSVVALNFLEYGLKQWELKHPGDDPVEIPDVDGMGVEMAPGVKGGSKDT